MRLPRRKLGHAASLFFLTMLALVPAEAASHVDLRPKQAPGGTATRFKLEVENERPDARTREIVMLVPAGVTVRTRRSSAGWRLRLRAQRLTLVAPQGGSLEGHDARSFPISMALPDRPGERLVFKVLQKYDSGEVVRWIGPAAAQDPAPRVRIRASAMPDPRPAPAQEAASESPSTTADGEGGGSGLVVAVAAAGAVGLAVGAIIAARRRRKRLG